MPINIKEIYLTDNDLDKIDKINYNFDQILGQGGGPQGLQGQQGLAGLQGPQGIQGPQGVQGQQGGAGSAANVAERWDSYTLTNGYNVIRPLNESVDKISRVVLGDTGVGFAVGAIPSYDPLALLSLARHNAGDIENAIEFKNSDPNGAEFILRNENGTLLLTSTTGVTGSGFGVDVPGEIRIESYDINIESTGTQIDFLAALDINSSASGNVNITALEDLSVKSETGVLRLEASGVNGEIEIAASGTNSAILIESLEAGVDIKAESGIVQLQENGLGTLNADAEDMTFDILNSVLIKGNNSTTLDSDQKVTLQIGGVDKFFVEQNINTSTQSIFFENANTGIMFKDGGGAQSGFLPAPNNTTSDSDRTLADYLNMTYTDNITFYKDTSNIGNFDVNLQYTGDELSDQFGIGGLIAINNGKNTVSYIKIGDLVNVWGTIYAGSDNNWDNVTDQLVLAIENDALFPYKNGWYDAVNDTYIGQPVLVDVTVGGSTSVDINDWNTSLNLGANADIIGIKGVIATGSSRMHLFWQVWDPINPNAASSYRNIPCQPDHFAYGGSNNSEPLSFTFSFSMPTSRKSYSKTAGQFWITAMYPAPTGGGALYSVSANQFEATSSVLSNSIIDAQCSNNTINTLSNWVPIDIPIDLESAGGDWAWDGDPNNTINNDFYDGAPSGSPLLGGAGFVGTSTIRPIRGVNTTGSDVTDTFVYKNTAYSNLTASVDIIHPNVSTFFTVGESTNISPVNDTIEGGIKVYSSSGQSGLTTFNLISNKVGDYDNKGKEYYKADLSVANEITISAEYARPFATIGHFTSWYVTSNRAYQGTQNVPEIFEIPAEIDAATHSSSGSISLSEFECWKIETNVSGNIKVGSLDLGQISGGQTTSANDIVQAFTYPENYATIGSDAPLPLGAKSTCNSGIRDPKIILSVQGESPNWNTPSSSNKIGVDTSQGFTDAVDGPWSNVDKEIITHWKHKQDATVPSQKIKVILKKDPIRFYHNGNGMLMQGGGINEASFRSSGKWANSQYSLGKSGSGNSTVSYGYSQVNGGDLWYKKDFIVFHEEVGLKWGVVGYNTNSTLNYSNFWSHNPMLFSFNGTTTTTPGQGGGNSTIITFQFNFTEGEAAMGGSKYIDLDIVLLPNYTSNHGNGRFPNIDCGSFGGNTANAPAQYSSPSNKPLNEQWYYVNQIAATRKESGGVIDQSNGNFSLGQDLNRISQRWAKKITIRLTTPTPQATGGIK
jgi:hypothetical protein